MAPKHQAQFPVVGGPTVQGHLISGGGTLYCAGWEPCVLAQYLERRGESVFHLTEEETEVKTLGQGLATVRPTAGGEDVHRRRKLMLGSVIHALSVSQHCGPSTDEMWYEGPHSTRLSVAQGLSTRGKGSPGDTLQWTGLFPLATLEWQVRDQRRHSSP